MSVDYKWASAVMSQLEDCQAEIARLREVISRAASHWIHLDPGVAWEGDIADAMAAAVAEIARLRITDAEREAIDTAEASLLRESTDLHTPLPVRQRLGSAAATLRGLRERLGGGR